MDDFDIIDAALAPFWGLSGVEVKRRLGVARGDGVEVRYCGFGGGGFTEGCGVLGGEVLRWFGDGDVGDIWAHLEGVDLLVNVLDEPRVLSGGVVGLADDDGSVVWTDHSHSRVWEDVTAVCDYGRGSDLVRDDTPTGEDWAITLSFSDGRSKTLDLCQHPEYSHLHGLWDSPTSFRTTRTAVPILSPAVLSTIGDIPIPAAAYTNKAYTYDELEDVARENRTAGLYWAGKTTGSFQGVVDQDWKKHHRQRFVALVNKLEAKNHTYLTRPNQDTAWQPQISGVLNTSLYSVHFTDVVQYADAATNGAIRSYFDIRAADARNESFKYTLNFDLDGNGHSGRFYRLLNSRSLPLKQTVFREWHDERLMPWLHYVPISLGMEELLEVVRYLAEEEEGRELAAFMAEEGRRWSLRGLRPVDQAVYLYRLMLELARLQDPDRLASS